jgi:hypothetical protein
MNDTPDRDLAVKTLREICEDFNAPKQAKATAARTLLELSGDIGKLQTQAPRETRALHELTRVELDAEIARIAVQAPALAPDGVQGLSKSKPKPNGAPARAFGRSKRKSKRTSKQQRASAPKYDF